MIEGYLTVSKEEAKKMIDAAPEIALLLQFTITTSTHMITNNAITAIATLI